ncbi:hypothetical protein R1sor_016789 [Riccia sorocarpa]|uniref:Uncharacterized protein n=1 Tax=Riccia sorocarpa TaxID=122646 RepID=A0ABD3HFX5_9MARC
MGGLFSAGHNYLGILGQRQCGEEQSGTGGGLQRHFSSDSTQDLIARIDNQGTPSGRPNFRASVGGYTNNHSQGGDEVSGEFGSHEHRAEADRRYFTGLTRQQNLTMQRLMQQYDRESAEEHRWAQRSQSIWIGLCLSTAFTLIIASCNNLERSSLWSSDGVNVDLDRKESAPLEECRYDNDASSIFLSSPSSGAKKQPARRFLKRAGRRMPCAMSLPQEGPPSLHCASRILLD